MEMEADSVAWVALLVTNKEQTCSKEKKSPDDVAGYAAPQHLLDTEDPDWLDNLQVAVQADQAEEGDAGIHVDVEENTHHFTQEERSFFVMEVDPHWQTQDQERVGQRQMTHIHRRGAISMGSYEENKDADGVAEEPETANDAVADGQEE